MAGYDVDGRTPQLDSTTWIGLFIGSWLAITLLSMLSSLAYCCRSLCWQRTALSGSTIELKNLSFNGTEDKSSSIVEQLLSSLLFTHSYPEAEKKKKKRKSKRKFKMKNGWRLVLWKRKVSRKKRKQPEQNVIDGPNSLHGDRLSMQLDFINGKDELSKILSYKPKLRVKQSCLVQLTKNTVSVIRKKRHQMGLRNMHKPNTLAAGCPPKLTGRRKTLKLLHHAKSRIKRSIVSRRPYHCHAQQFYNSRNSCCEEFSLELPVQDTDNQSDEFCGYIVQQI